MKEQINTLIAIGFNKLEADVYIYLLSHPPATAYKIGKEINKPTANVYKAIDSLSVKGAVLIEDNKNKLCKAVNSQEFIAAYTSETINNAARAEKALANFNVEVLDQNSYKIQSVALVFERFQNMMDRCKKIAVIDAFPNVLELLVPIIEKAANRNIDIYVEAYKPIEIKNVSVVCPDIGEQNLQHWNSQQLNLIIDGEEHLITLMDNDLTNVIQATWSNNIYMSCMLHAGFLREHTLMKILSEYNNPDFETKTKSILNNQKFFYNSDIPGFNKLFNLNK